MTVIEHAPAVDKFSAPLYTQHEAARFLDLPRSTFAAWARGYGSTGGSGHGGAPVITALPVTAPRGPSIPFVGLAEGYTLSALRRAGVPLQRIRPAIEQLDRELGLGHALASRRLYTDGAEVLFDYGERAGGDERDAVGELVVVRHGQRVFTEVVAGYLRRVEFGADGLAAAVPLPGFRRAELVADVVRSFGRPIFRHGGARLEDVLSLFKAERDIDLVSEEFGVPRAEIEDVLAVLVN